MGRTARHGGQDRPWDLAVLIPRRAILARACMLAESVHDLDSRWTVVMKRPLEKAI
jgi:hypothetical protein